MAPAVVAPATDAGPVLEGPRRPAPLELARALARTAVFAAKASRPQHDRPVPRLHRAPLTLATVLADELLVTGVRLATRNLSIDTATLRADLDVAVDVLGAGGYLDDPGRLHPVPGLPELTRVTQRRIGSQRFEHVSFPSVYEPPAAMPRAAEWRADRSNHVAHAYVVRHDDSTRPWVVLLHGHRAGEPLDLWLMGSARLGRALGVNVVHPVLPLHGPRGRATTLQQFPSLDPLVNFYGLSQGMWDVRQVLAWVRAQGAATIGIHGMSLGGHAAALLASLEPGLSCVVAGIPTADFSTMLARQVARFESEELVRATGLLDEPARTVNRLVSPLAFQPLVPKDGRFIYAGVGDRVTTPEQAVELWRHWDEPRILWLQRGHVASFAARPVRRFVAEALRSAGVTSTSPGARP